MVVWESICAVVGVRYRSAKASHQLNEIPNLKRVLILPYSELLALVFLIIIACVCCLSITGSFPIALFFVLSVLKILMVHIIKHLMILYRGEAPEKVIAPMGLHVSLINIRFEVPNTNHLAHSLHELIVHMLAGFVTAFWLFLPQIHKLNWIVEIYYLL